MHIFYCCESESELIFYLFDECNIMGSIIISFTAVKNPWKSSQQQFI